MRYRTPLIILIAILVILALCWSLWGSEVFAAHDEGSISVTMCPDCKAEFLKEIKGGGEIECALYDVGSEVGGALKAVNAQVITDDETKPYYGKLIVESGLMHNKFCVINRSIVLTGSYNPTDGGEKNRNNLLVIKSKALAKDYLLEFEAISSYRSHSWINHIVWINGTRTEVYFCPEDGCEAHAVAALAKAQHDVKFLTFSFTSDAIGKELRSLQERGVRVQGICDGGQIRSEAKFSECPALNAKNWTGPGLLHHKVFIIDGQTVITGSYNPTASGNKRNRENMIIITDPALASQYLDEYNAIDSMIR